MQENQNNAWKILRTSSHTFLTHIHHFTSTPTFLVLPFSLSLLLHHLSTASTTASSPLHHRLHTILLAAGFPLNTPFSILLLHKLSQTLSAFIFSIPFSIFLLLSKSSTVHSLQILQFSNDIKPNLFPLILTHICNIFVIIAANSGFFTLLFLVSTITTATETDSIFTWVFAIGSVLYSVVVANAVVICNLALISSGWEGKGGILAILRACTLVRGNTTTALVLAFPANLAMAGVEMVFWCKIYGGAEERLVWAVAAEAVLIGYMYSTLFVWDTIVGCFFYKSCKEEVEEKEYICDLEKLRALEEGF